MQMWFASTRPPTCPRRASHITAVLQICVIRYRYPCRASIVLVSVVLPSHRKCVTFKFHSLLCFWDITQRKEAPKYQATKGSIRYH